MRDIPIIFSAPMVLALLAGRKTQTRRLAFGPWKDCEDQPSEIQEDWECRGRDLRIKGGAVTGWRMPSPWQRVRPGDRLWVREGWAAHWANDDLPPVQIDPAAWSVRYLADDTIRPARDGSLALADQCRKGRPSIHMPRWASRLTLTVTEVRAQRLQDISEADAWAEGCKPGPPNDAGGFFPAEEPHPKCGLVGWDSAQDWFADLWQKLHGPDAWAANPAVVALTFTVEQRNIDA
jgi:hypothetical protein